MPSEPSKNLNSSAPSLADPSTRLEEREETLELIFANPKAREILDLGDERPPKRMPDCFGDCDLREMISRCATRRECEERWVRGDDTLFRIKFDHLPKFDNHRGGVLIMIRDLSEERRLEMNQ